jgi:hypothetical protein
MNKKRIFDGAINFKNLKYLPTLVFYVVDYENEESMENWDYAILDDVEYNSLENTIDNFNDEIMDIAYDVDNNTDYYTLKDLQVKIKDGYYEGCQLWVEDRLFDDIEDFKTKEEVLKLFKNFFKQVKQDYNLTSIKAGWVTSIVDSKYNVEDSIKFRKFIKEVIDTIKDTINLFIKDTGFINSFYPDFRENKFVIEMDDEVINSRIVNKLLAYLNPYMYDTYGITFKNKGDFLVSRESFTPKNI